MGKNIGLRFGGFDQLQTKQNVHVLLQQLLWHVIIIFYIYITQAHKQGFATESQ